MCVIPIQEFPWVAVSTLIGIPVLLQQLRETSEHRKELERQHAQALAQLREKKEEVSRLNPVGESDKKKSADTIEALQVWEEGIGIGDLIIIE